MTRPAADAAPLYLDDAFDLDAYTTTRRRLMRDLESFLRYRHRLAAAWVAERENWNATGKDGEVWMEFKGSLNRRFRAVGTAEDFADWQAAS